MSDQFNFDISDREINNGRVTEGFSNQDGHHPLAVMDVTFKDKSGNTIAINEIAFTKQELETMLVKIELMENR